MGLEIELVMKAEPTTLTQDRVLENKENEYK